MSGTLGYEVTLGDLMSPEEETALAKKVTESARDLATPRTQLSPQDSDIVDLMTQKEEEADEGDMVSPPRSPKRWKRAVEASEHSEIKRQKCLPLEETPLSRGETQGKAAAAVRPCADEDSEAALRPGAKDDSATAPQPGANEDSEAALRLSSSDDDDALPVKGRRRSRCISSDSDSE